MQHSKEYPLSRRRSLVVLFAAVAFPLLQPVLVGSTVEAQTGEVTAGQTWSRSLIDGGVSWSKGAENTAEAMDVILDIAKVPGEFNDFVSPAADTWLVFKTIPGKNPRVGDDSLAEAEPSLKESDRAFCTGIRLNTNAQHNALSFLIVAEIGSKWQATLRKRPLDVIVVEHGPEADVYVSMKSLVRIP